MADPTLAEAGEVQPSETAAPAATDSLNSPGKEQKTFDERVANASSPAEMLALIEELRGPAPEKPAETSPETTETTTAETATEKPEDGERKTENGAEKPETETEKPAEGETKPETAEKPETEEEREEGKLPERIRMKDWANHERLAMQLKRENPKLTLAQAEKLAKETLGIKDEPAADTTKPADDGKPKSITEADTQITDLQAKADKAWDDLDFGAARKLDKQVSALKEHKVALAERAAATKREGQAAYERDFTTHETKAKSLYDFVGDEKSAGYQRMVEIDAALEANGDPLFHSPEKPLRLAQMAARELHIAPKAPGAKPASKTAVVPKKPVPPVAPGTSRTSSTTTQGGDLDKAIESIRTPEDLERFIASQKKRT